MGYADLSLGMRPGFVSGRHRAMLWRIGGRAVLALMMLIWMVPLYWLVNTAFKYKAQIQSYAPVWLPQPPTLGNIAWIVGHLDHAALSRFPTRANKHLEFWIISTRIMPPAALIMPYYFLLLRTRLLNTQTGLTLLYIAIDLPLACWIMLAYLRSLPEDSEEAARIDGCSRWGAFWHVVLPATRSSVAAAGLLVTILTWNEFFIAFVVTSSNITFPVQVAGFLATGMNPQYGHMAAAGLLLSLPTVLLALIFHKSLISGLHAFVGTK